MRSPTRLLHAWPALAMALALAWPAAAAGNLEDLLQELQIVPLDRQPAPAFTLESLEGRKVSWSDYRDRPVLLYFWATWCPFCTRELPSTIEEVHREYGPRGLAVVAVNILESRNEVAIWVSQKKVTSTVLLDTDGAVTAAYRVTGTPTVVLVGRDGKLVGRAAGMRPWMSTAGRAFLTALLRLSGR